MWELDYKESWAPKSWCFWTVVLEKTLESPLDCKEIQLVNPKGNQLQIFIGRTDAEVETPILYFGHLMWRTDSLEKLWCWVRLKEGREGDDRGWDGWMASPTRWTWVWVGSGSWWWTGRPGVLQSMGSQRVRHDWWTELRWQNKQMLEKRQISPAEEFEINYLATSFLRREHNSLLLSMGCAWQLPSTRENRVTL